MNKYFFNLEDYKINSISFWPRFSSTSRKYNVARNFNTKNGETVVFEIYLNSNNDPPTSIPLPDLRWSFYPGEAEVLLFPFFRFQTTKVEIYEEQHLTVTKVTLVELPYQNPLHIHCIDYYRVVWLDTNVVTTHENIEMVKYL